jgi:hypothetical protein
MCPPPRRAGWRLQTGEQWLGRRGRQQALNRSSAVPLVKILSLACRQPAPAARRREKPHSLTQPTCIVDDIVHPRAAKGFEGRLRSGTQPLAAGRQELRAPSTSEPIGASRSALPRRTANYQLNHPASRWQGQGQGQAQAQRQVPAAPSHLSPTKSRGSSSTSPSGTCWQHSCFTACRAGSRASEGQMESKSRWQTQPAPQ